jgi:hypothetical protein
MGLRLIHSRSRVAAALWMDFGRAIVVKSPPCPSDCPARSDPSTAIVGCPSARATPTSRTTASSTLVTFLASRSSRQRPFGVVQLIKSDQVPPDSPPPTSARTTARVRLPLMRTSADFAVDGIFSVHVSVGSFHAFAVVVPPTYSLYPRQGRSRHFH